MDSQQNELRRGEKTNHNPNRYRLRSKKKEGKLDISDHPTRAEKSVKNVADGIKEKEANPPLVVKIPILKVKEILKSPSSFIFEHEIQNIRIHVPLSDLVEHKGFKRCLSKIL
jgi:hypothetical protein